MHIYCEGGRYDEAEVWDECGTHCIVCTCLMCCLLTYALCYMYCYVALLCAN